MKWHHNNDNNIMKIKEIVFPDLAYPVYNNFCGEVEQLVCK